MTTIRRMAHTALGIAVAAGTLTLSASAQARSLVYYQDWQEPDAFGVKWLSTGGCATFSRNPAALPPDVQSSTPAAPECTGRHATETIAWSGGRSSARSTFQVAVGDKYCVTAWVRANAGAGGANRAKPFIGLNFSSSATGFPENQGSVGGCRNGEHWLIGTDNFNDNLYRDNCAQDQDNCCNGRSTSGFGAVTNIPDNAVGWNFYAKEFTVLGNDVNNFAGTTNRAILKLQNFSGNGSCMIGAPNDSVPGADFDDIRVYKLGDEEVCPTEAQVLAEGDDRHGTCDGTTPFCSTRNVNVQVAGEANPRVTPQTYCAGCTGSLGDGTPTSCANPAQPACAADGSCQACNGDAGSAGTLKCGAASPVCNPDHTCGQCNDAQDCAAVAGISRSGALCVNGACTDACTIGADGTSAACGANRFCVTGAGAGCVNKLANGADIPSRPEENAAERGKCVPVGTPGASHITATIFCASGVCSDDNKCGLKNEEPCSQATGAAQCRAGVCGADDKCGLANGAACTDNAQCRNGDCNGGNCGGQQSECEIDTDCGATGFVCDASKRCAIGCRNGQGCPAGKECNSATADVGQCVDAQSSSSSSGGSTTSSSGNTSSSSGASGNTSSSGATGSSSGETPSGSSSTSSGDGTGDGTGGDDGEGGGCSTSGSGAGSFTPVLIGLGVAMGAFRRRRKHAAS